MSTKIWEAYRLRPGFDLWEVITNITEHGRKRATATLHAAMRPLVANARAATNLGLALTFRPKATELDRYGAVSRAIRHAYKAQVGDYKHNLWDLDVSVAVHKVGRKYLFRPFAGSGLLRGTLAFLRRHPALEDYHYQNASDRPEKISARAWAARAAVWDRTMYPNWDWRPFLHIDVVSLSLWTQIDPTTGLLREALKAAKHPKDPQRSRRKR